MEATFADAVVDALKTGQSLSGLSMADLILESYYYFDRGQDGGLSQNHFTFNAAQSELWIK